MTARILCFLAPWLVATLALAADDSDIAVEAVKDGATIHVEVDCPVNASRAIVWDVITDYDHMASFLPNVKQSVVRTRVGNRLQVYQKGQASRGPLTIGFENVREVDLVAQTEVHSRVVSGDTMPAEFITRIVERDGSLHIVHTGTYTPNMWVPPGIGPSLIAAETRRQYGDIRNEILRRAARTPTQ
jgi:hypothetical protein